MRKIDKRWTWRNKLIIRIELTASLLLFFSCLSRSLIRFSLSSHVSYGLCNFKTWHVGSKIIRKVFFCLIFNFSFFSLVSHKSNIKLMKIVANHFPSDNGRQQQRVLYNVWCYSLCVYFYWNSIFFRFSLVFLFFMFWFFHPITF